MVRSLKNPVTPPGIDPGTVRLVAQRLNHYATPGPPMKQSTSGKYDDQEDTRISWKPKVHHRTYNSPKRKPYPTSNGFNPHGHIPISTISLVHMATLLSVRIVTLLYLRPTQSTWPHSYVHDQFSPHDHTPISTNNPVHMATNLYLRTIQSTWPQSYIYDQFSPHGHILMSTINSVHIIHTPVSTIKVLFFHLHLGFQMLHYVVTTPIHTKCRAAMARHPTVRQ